MNKNYYCLYYFKQYIQSNLLTLKFKFLSHVYFIQFLIIELYLHL